MSYLQVVRSCLADSIGEAGLPQKEFEALAAEAQAIAVAIGKEAAAGAFCPLTLACETGDLDELERVALKLRQKFDCLIVLGTGGASLAGQALVSLSPSNGIEFLDNLDANDMNHLMCRDNLERTGFLVVSKSGATAETLSQLLVCLTAMRKVSGDAAGEHFLLISEPGDNALRRISARYNLEILDHSPHIGGRFSVLSLVGVLPALFVGQNAWELRKGAAEVFSRTIASGVPADPAIGAALAVGLARHCGVGISVMMPYANRLKPFSAWYCQLWAESLGKDGLGTTPVQANGPVDQHSQLQLYLAGPVDKMFTLIGLNTKGQGPVIDGQLAREIGTEYLDERTIGDVVDALYRSTAEMLALNGRPTRIIEVSKLDEATMGALFMHFMLETHIAARLMGVNAGDQPAVEDGKVLTRRLLKEGDV